MFQLAAAAVLAGACALAAPAGAVGTAGAAGPAAVTVTVGGSALTVSRSTGVPAGLVAITVVNRGSRAVTVSVCARAGAAAGTAACAPRSFGAVAPGRSARLAVALTPGSHAVAATRPGSQAIVARGRIAVLPPATPAPAATTAVATTAAPPAAPAAPEAREALLGDPVAGLQLFKDNGCGDCHTLRAAGATGAAAPDLDGRRPDQAKVAFNVKAGAYGGSGIVMPQFDMTPKQLADIAAFVYQATHP